MILRLMILISCTKKFLVYFQQLTNCPREFDSVSIDNA